MRSTDVVCAFSGRLVKIRLAVRKEILRVNNSKAGVLFETTLFGICHLGRNSLAITDNNGHNGPRYRFITFNNPEPAKLHTYPVFRMGFAGLDLACLFRKTMR